MKKILSMFLSGVLGLSLLLGAVHPAYASVTQEHIISGSQTNTASFNTGSVDLDSLELELLRVTSRTGISTEPNQPSVSGAGITWVPITSVYFDTDGSSRKKQTLFRAMGTPSVGSLTVSFSGQTQTDVTYSLEELAGVDTSGSNGSGAIAQFNTNTDTDGGSISVSLSSFSDSANNVAFGSFSADSGMGTMTAGSGFTKIGGVDTSVIQTGSEYVLGQDTSVDAVFDSVSGARTGGIAVEVKSAGGSPTPTATPTLTPTPTSMLTPTPTPTINPNRPDHTVIVVGENRKLQDVLRVGYFTELANEGALMVNSKAFGHPSQPEYFRLFSGSNQGVTDDTCIPPGSPFSGNNLGNQLLVNGFGFIGYAESMPTNPRTNCTNTNGWDNNHAPWLHFTNIPSGSVKAFTDFPTDFTTLPTVSFVIPNLNHNAHDGSIEDMSAWMSANIDAYKDWAVTHNSLLVVTFDEDDEIADNTIYTAFVGPMIKKGLYNEAVDHYIVLSTIEDLYGLPHLKSGYTGLTDIFVN